MIKSALIVFLLLCINFGFSQTASISPISQGIAEEYVGLNPDTDTDWSFFLDEENEVYYIDFETISVNLSDIQIFNSAGELLLNDQLWNLPVSTIYEVDFSKYKPGNYTIQLRTFTSMIKKTVIIQ